MHHLHIRFLCLHEAAIVALLLWFFWPNIRIVFHWASFICTSETAIMEHCSHCGEVYWSFVTASHHVLASLRATTHTVYVLNVWFFCMGAKRFKFCENLCLKTLHTRLAVFEESSSVFPIALWKPPRPSVNPWPGVRMWSSRWWRASRWASQLSLSLSPEPTCRFTGGSLAWLFMPKPGGAQNYFLWAWGVHRFVHRGIRQRQSTLWWINFGGQTVHTFLPTSDTLSSFGSFTSAAQQVLVCSNCSASLSFDMKDGKYIRLSPLTTCSFVTCCSRGRRRVRLSPRARRPCTSHRSGPYISPSGLPHPASGSPSWWMMLSPRDNLSTQVCPLECNTLLSLSQLFHEWKRLPGVSPWVLRTVQFGYTLQFCRSLVRETGLSLSTWRMPIFIFRSFGNTASSSGSPLGERLTSTRFFPLAGLGTKDIHKVHGCCSGPIDNPGHPYTQWPGRLAHLSSLQGISELPQGCSSSPHSVS